MPNEIGLFTRSVRKEFAKITNKPEAICQIHATSFLPATHLNRKLIGPQSFPEVGTE